MKRRFGDRKDGKKIRDIDGFHKIMIDIKSERCDADVYINQKFVVKQIFTYCINSFLNFIAILNAFKLISLCFMRSVHFAAAPLNLSFS